MRKLNYTKEIKESGGKLLRLRDQQKQSLYYRRLHFLYLLKSNPCCTQQQAGDTIGIKSRAAQKLWNKYRHQGVQGLLAKAERGRPAKLHPEAVQAIQTELNTDRIQTLKQACAFVLHNNGISISQVAMHRYFKQEGIKKKSGRPTNVRKDIRGEKRFKKKSFQA